MAAAKPFQEMTGIADSEFAGPNDLSQKGRSAFVGQAWLEKTMECALEHVSTPPFQGFMKT